MATCCRRLAVQEAGAQGSCEQDASADLACEIATSAGTLLCSLEVTKGRPASWRAVPGPGRWSRWRRRSCAPAAGKASRCHLWGATGRDLLHMDKVQ